MPYINKIEGLLIALSVLSCSLRDDDDDVPLGLASYLEGRTFEVGAVIACAASDDVTKDILTFYYPEAGASDIRYYETEHTQVDKDVFSNYIQVFLQNAPVFNGHLGRFIQSASTEKWIIVTFELDGKVKVSNPIRSKQISKPTVWNDAVSVDQSQAGMPDFLWEANAYGDNAIYFQVVSDDQNNLLSGTYTYENHFQYYNSSNVVLNVTTQTPPTLVLTNTYNFTLIDVSEDNWVNWVVLKSFTAE